MGVPLTLLEIDPELHKYAVVEAGINQPGEMEQLAYMINAEYSIVTLIGQSHLEGLGTVEKVADEKSRIFNTPGNNSKVFFPNTCQNYAPFKKENLNGRDYIVLKQGEPTGRNIEENEAFLTFGLKQNKRGLVDATAGVTSPHFQ